MKLDSEMKALVAPSININGTSGDELIHQIRVAHSAVEEAFRALLKAAPHGRDYQTVSSEQYTLARHQHNIRLIRLDDTIKELEQIAVLIQNQRG
jgi:hypothetical protein